MSRQTTFVRFVTCAAISLATVSAEAGPVSKSVQEAAEYVMRKFGTEAAAEGVETIASKLESLSLKYGDDVLTAAREGGPKAIGVLEHAGENAPQLAKLLSREGDKALWIAEDSARASLFAKYGDDAAKAMLKHKSLADPLIAKFQAPAARAMEAVNGPNARRLAMMANDGELAAIGQTPALLDTVGKYGDRAMDFIWRNKKALAVGTAAAAFLHDPQSFLDGTRDIAEVVSRELVTPVATEVAKRADWTWIGVTAMLSLGIYLSIRYYLRLRFARW